MLRIGIVSGEASGDLLASGLIETLKTLSPDIEFEGIGGPLMESAGCRILYPSERLAVMGLLEVAGRYLELVKIRRNLINHFISNPPDLFIGVDAPDFNLDLEARLRNVGIRTVHYVGPTVWAWRSGRLNKIRRAVDLMLVLFPFEQSIYQDHGIPVKFVGHPLADRIQPVTDRKEFKIRLGINEDKSVIAIMPGSRLTEIERLFPVQLETIVQINHKVAGMCFLISVLEKRTAEFIENKLAEASSHHQIDYQVLINQSQKVLSAADAGLLASGTITLEAMLCGLPMVVMYKMNWISYKVIKSMVKVNNISLPNLLADHPVVTEFLQDRCDPRQMADHILELLDGKKRNLQINEFSKITRHLKQDANLKASRAVLELLQ